MAKSFEISVNPNVIKWARESAGFSIEETAKKLKTNKENYERIESGQKKPTFRQLEILSHCFKRPVAVFLLSQPPDEPELSASFRIMPKSEQQLSKDLRLSIRKARYHQSVANELMRNLDINTKPQIFSLTIKEDPVRVARRERNRIGIPIDKQFSWRNAYEAFNEWRDAVESLNILVFQLKFPLEDARGFSLMDKEPPVIVLNTADNILARIFTLFHEYAHIILRMPEIYTGEEQITNHTRGVWSTISVLHVENWCNQFASELLIPEDILKAEKDYQDFLSKRASLVEILENLSRRFVVSKYSILTRLRTFNIITQNEYEKEALKLKSQFMEHRYGAPFIERKKSGFILPHKRCIQEKGKKFISIVMDSKERGLITSADVIDYLSLKLSNLRKVAELSLE